MSPEIVEAVEILAVSNNLDISAQELCKIDAQIAWYKVIEVTNDLHGMVQLFALAYTNTSYPLESAIGMIVKSENHCYSKILYKPTDHDIIFPLCFFGISTADIIEAEECFTEKTIALLSGWKFDERLLISVKMDTELLKLLTHASVAAGFTTVEDFASDAISQYLVDFIKNDLGKE